MRPRSSRISNSTGIKSLWATAISQRSLAFRLIQVPHVGSPKFEYALSADSGPGLGTADAPFFGEQAVIEPGDVLTIQVAGISNPSVEGPAASPEFGGWAVLGTDAVSVSFVARDYAVFAPGTEIPGFVFYFFGAASTHFIPWAVGGPDTRSGAQAFVPGPVACHPGQAECITVSQIQVTMFNNSKTVVWCDTSVMGCANPIWNLPAGGITLGQGDTLVLTQTGFISGPFGNASNFDTSDLASTSGTSDCGGSDGPCSVEIALNTGAGLAIVYPSSAADIPLNNFNNDPGGLHNEASTYQTLVTMSNYTLGVGYADDVHPDTSNCPGTGCFPNPFDGSGGTSKATLFIGKGLPGGVLIGKGLPGGVLSSPCPGNCYDAGVIIIRKAVTGKGQ
jgi:hypothetical protein